MSALALAAAGCAAGAAGALLGLGGGFLLVPVLILAFGMAVRPAVAAGLVATIATSSAAGSVNVERGTVNLRLGIALEAATVAGAWLGGAAARLAPERLLLGLFSALLAAITALLLRGPGADGAPSAAGSFKARYRDPAEGREVAYGVRRLPAAFSASLGAGALSSLLGVGGGVLKVPVLHLFCGMPMKAAAATSNFMVGATAASGAVVYLLGGEVEPRATAWLALGALAGSFAGAAWLPRTRERGLRRGFAALTAALCLQMARRALGA